MSTITTASPTTASTNKFNGKIPEFYDNGHGNYVMGPYAKAFIDRVREILPSVAFTQPLNILELACGTGRLTKELVQAFPNASITATDLSPEMIAHAQTLIEGHHNGHQQLIWEVADMQALPYANESFDLLFCQYGYMFCPDKEKAFHESYRVLKPANGKLFGLVWDKIESHPLLFPLYQHVTMHYPTLSTTFFLTPCNMFDRDLISRLLIEHGHLHDVKIESLVIHTGYPDKKQALHYMIEGTPLLNTLIQEGIEPQVFEEAAQGIYDHFQEPEHTGANANGRLSFDMHAILLYGHK